jgi:hypothetical protein
MYRDGVLSMVDELKGSDGHCHAIDLWTDTSDGKIPASVVSGINANSEDDLRDGLHLGPNGNAIVFEKLQILIRACYGDEYCPDDGPDGVARMQMHLPYWRELAVDHGGSKEEQGKYLREWKFEVGGGGGDGDAVR